MPNACLRGHQYSEQDRLLPRSQIRLASQRIDRMANYQKPDRIGQHAVIKLDGQRVFKEISPQRRLEPQSPGGWHQPAIDERPCIEAHTGIKPRHKRAEINLQQNERAPPGARHYEHAAMQ